MSLLEWFRPGIKVKRWISFGVMGVLLIVFAMIELVRNWLYNINYKLFWLFLIFVSIYVISIAISEGVKSVMILVNKGQLDLSIDSKKLGNLIYEKRLLVKGPKIVVIGGGTGLSTMLRGLKYYTSNISAVVTVADDGGGSGDLREDLGILPPGDIRNCILALADTEPLMQELLQYRFPEGKLKNQSFGNLFLAAMHGISDNFEDAVRKMASVLAVTGKVIPVTLENMILKAVLENGQIIEGESAIPKEALRQQSHIKNIFIEPEDARPPEEALNVIKNADAIILGPGSLYTSVIPNLLVKDIRKAIKNSDAIKIYVSNIMTQPGETDDYTVADHVNAIKRHCDGDMLIDYVVVNNREIHSEFEEKYLSEGAKFVKTDERTLRKKLVGIIEGDFASIRNGHIRHDTEKLASILIETIMERKLLYDKKKIIEYFYLSERLKEIEKNNKEK